MNYKTGLTPVRSVSMNDTIYFEEDVLARRDGHLFSLGHRINVCRVVAIDGRDALIKIVKSSGKNANGIGAVIVKSIACLKQGYLMENDAPKRSDTLESGGHLEGTDNGKKVALSDASKGGMSVGSKHTEGGIKGSVGTTEKPIEFEGDEIILTAPVSDNPAKYEFDGKQMTAKQIASQLNVDNGGVSFAEGGDVATKCRCSGKEYKFGGETKSDRDIINYVNSVGNVV